MSFCSKCDTKHLVEGKRKPVLQFQLENVKVTGRTVIPQ